MLEICLDIIKSVGKDRFSSSMGSSLNGQTCWENGKLGQAAKKMQRMKVEARGNSDKKNVFSKYARKATTLRFISRCQKDYTGFAILVYGLHPDGLLRSFGYHLRLCYATVYPSSTNIVSGILNLLTAKTVFNRKTAVPVDAQWSALSRNQLQYCVTFFSSSVGLRYVPWYLMWEQ